MSSAQKIIQAAAGNAGEPLYVEDVFSTYLYEGNASSQTITNGINLEEEGGLTWFKARDDSTFHILFDTERGGTKWLRTDSTNDANDASPAWIEFNTDGFNLTQGINGLNNTQSMASWTFRKAPKFFDVVTYTGTGSAQAIAHNLGTEPGFIVVKSSSHDNTNWICYHRSIDVNGDNAPETDYIYLNTTAGAADSAAPWADTAPTSTHFTVGTSASSNDSGRTYVAYLFAHNDGDGGFGEDADQDIIKCGSYTGNDGTQDIDVGFEPQWVMIKNTGNTSNWAIFDVMRGFTRPISTAGPDSIAIYPNDTGAEAGIARIFPTVNGFGFISEAGGTVNTLHDFIYVAIRRGPMKTPESGTDVFNAEAWTGTGSTQTYSNGFPVDAIFHRYRTGSDGTWLYDRLRGRSKRLITSSTGAESSAGFLDFDKQDSIGINGNASGFNASGETYIHHNFRRAPGFFDMVAYEGTGGSSSVKNHNLGVTPELIIIKNRTSSTDWPVWVTGFQVGSESDYLLLNSNAAKATSPSNSNNPFFADPTDTTFTVGSWSRVNDGANSYIAYLFATLPGISKVGSYTGNGTSQTIDCGFSAGARFVLIKESSGLGDWNAFDTERGIVAGNDPRLELNTTDAEDTGGDLVDPVSSGFAVTSDTKVNTNNATYIFLAIA